MTKIATRWATPAAIVALTLVGLLWEGPDVPRAVAALVTMAAATLLHAGSRVVVPNVVVVGAGITVVCHGSASNVGWFALVVLAGWAATVAVTPVWLGTWVGAVVVLSLQWATTEDDPGWAAWIGGTTFAAVGCRFGRRQHQLADQLRQAQVGLADRARAEERHRIAREVHDVVAHTLTVALLHVTSAKLALDDDPADAARALDEAERLGRAALTEVRQAVGLLGTSGSGAAAAAPLPGAEQLGELVDGFRQAGAQVMFTTDEAAGRLPATTGLVIYSILREGLTNSVRHAPGGVTTARLSVSDGLVTLTVDNTAVAEAVGPAGRGGTQLGTGMGLHSMRQRAESLGGSCVAGPRGTEWRVRAEIPLREALERPEGPANVLAAP